MGAEEDKALYDAMLSGSEAELRAAVDRGANFEHGFRALLRLGKEVKAGYTARGGAAALRKLLRLTAARRQAALLSFPRRSAAVRVPPSPRWPSPRTTRRTTSPTRRTRTVRPRRSSTGLESSRAGCAGAGALHTLLPRADAPRPRALPGIKKAKTYKYSSTKGVRLGRREAGRRRAGTACAVPARYATQQYAARSLPPCRPWHRSRLLPVRADPPCLVP
jgi:hypothetical protein